MEVLQPTAPAAFPVDDFLDQSGAEALQMGSPLVPRLGSLKRRMENPILSIKRSRCLFADATPAASIADNPANRAPEFIRSSTATAATTTATATATDAHAHAFPTFRLDSGEQIFFGIPPACTSAVAEAAPATTTTYSQEFAEPLELPTVADADQQPTAGAIVPLIEQARLRGIMLQSRQNTSIPPSMPMPRPVLPLIPRTNDSFQELLAMLRAMHRARSQQQPQYQFEEGTVPAATPSPANSPFVYRRPRTWTIEELPDDYEDPAIKKEKITPMMMQRSMAVDP